MQVPLTVQWMSRMPYLKMKRMMKVWMWDIRMLMPAVQLLRRVGQHGSLLLSACAKWWPFVMEMKTTSHWQRQRLCDRVGKVWPLFTCAIYASAVLVVIMCQSICLSVTSQCSTKMAKPTITQTTPYNSPGTLIFWCQKFRREFQQGHPQRRRQIEVG